jgi:CRISP-associated protein Cas1
MHLVLNSYGASLRKENGLFKVFTHEGDQTIYPSDLKSISISKGARISSDAVILAIENEIDVLFIDSTGMPLGRVWSIKYGSISEIRRKQLDFTTSKQCIDWVKNLILEKLNNQLAIISTFEPESVKNQNMINSAIRGIESLKEEIEHLEGESIRDISPKLRGFEGAAARRYFKLISELLPEEYSFDQRSSRPAKDKFNATLNYGYGMLYGKIESALIKAGIDPYIGVFHMENFNRPALVFDVIEKFRVWIDYVVIQLFTNHSFSDDCFQKTENSYLLDGLGKRILIQSVNDYLAEIITYNKLSRSRAVHIDLYAQSLAQFFLKQ